MPDAPRVICLEPRGPKETGLTRLDLDPADFQSDLPDQNGHVYWGDYELGLCVRIWDTATMQDAYGPYPGDEIMMIQEGRFKMVERSDEPVQAIEDGQSVCIRNGIPISWKQEGNCGSIT
jgi:hypothetical protein